MTLRQVRRHYRKQARQACIEAMREQVAQLYRAMSAGYVGVDAGKAIAVESLSSCKLTFP